MAAMSTALTEFADNGNARTFTLETHTAIAPNLVLQKRKVPSGNQTVVEDTFTVLLATEDSNGDALPSRVAFTVTVRRPVDGISADVDAALAILRDIVAGDEFANVVATQEWLA
jgi:hypothetical protein